jgi:hypothetical protein
MCGEPAARESWLTVVDGLTPADRVLCDERAAEMFEALLLLHERRAGEAARLLAADVEDDKGWSGESAWRTWYTALAAEASVLSRQRDAAQRLAVALRVAEGNPVATALVERAEALAAHDTARVRAAGEALRAAGCRYQWARSLLLSGDGDDALLEMGAPRTDESVVDPWSPRMSWPAGKAIVEPSRTDQEVDAMMTNPTIANEIAAARRRDLHAEAATHRLAKLARGVVSRRTGTPAPDRSRSYRPATA